MAKSLLIFREAFFCVLYCAQEMAEFWAMILLEYGNLKTEVPGTWDELSEKQLVKAIQILSQERNKVTGQLAVIHFLLPRKFKKQMENFTGLELVELLNQFEFLCTPASFSKMLIKRLRKSWFSAITYHGASDSLSNLTVREFGAAELYLNQYAQKIDSDPVQAEECLNKFLGSLFFKKRHGYRYVPMNGSRFNLMMKRNALDLAAIPLLKKQAIAFNYSAVREYVFSQFKDAFTKNGTRSEMDKYGWDGFVLFTAKSDHKPVDEIYHMNLLEFLVQLDCVAIKENERETT